MFTFLVSFPSYSFMELMDHDHIEDEIKSQDSSKFAVPFSYSKCHSFLMAISVILTFSSLLFHLLKIFLHINVKPKILVATLPCLSVVKRMKRLPTHTYGFNAWLHVNCPHLIHPSCASFLSSRFLELIKLGPSLCSTHFI